VVSTDSEEKEFLRVEVAKVDRSVAVDIDLNKIEE
jgi:hypothetical protein